MSSDISLSDFLTLESHIYIYEYRVQLMESAHSIPDGRNVSKGVLWFGQLTYCIIYIDDFRHSCKVYCSIILWSVVMG